MSARVLVVDDDPVTVTLLEAMLQAHDYVVDYAFSGKEALDILAREKFNLVLLDLVMDDISGLDVLKEVRKKFDLLELPVLMVSANHEPAPMVAALELGANDYLTKPVADALLLAKVKRHLQLKRVSEFHPEITTRSLLLPGARLGHYEISGLRAEGGMGRVYLAQDVRLTRKVAVKVALGSDGDALNREAMALARINHPHVVTLHDIGNEPLGFLVLEYLEGQSLAEYKPMPVPSAQAVRWTVEILEGLEAAHERGVVHGDLKPENVMITSSGRVKLMDFGVSRLAGPDEGQALEVTGTPAYMAPEQIDSCFGGINARSDLFAAAGILYYLLSGRPPFLSRHHSQMGLSIVFREPDSLQALNPEVSRELQEVCFKGLQKNQNRRFQTAGQFRQALLDLRVQAPPDMPGWLRATPNSVLELQSPHLSPPPLTELGPYEIQTRLGQGQMATVYRARDTRNQRTVALKVLRPEFRYSPDFVRRFEREMSINQGLKHPNLIEICESGNWEGQLYIAMELAEGLSLTSILEDGPLPLEDFPLLATQMAAGLHYAHRHNLFHRDIKPDNIFVGRDALVKILDFGLAIEAGQSRFTSAGYAMGTPDYMAPEGLTSGISDALTDQYSLGVVFYQMLTGQVPFSGATPVEVGFLHIKQVAGPLRNLRPEIPQSWEDIVLRMLSKSPEDRFPDLSGVRTLLQAALTDR